MRFIKWLRQRLRAFLGVDFIECQHNRLEHRLGRFEDWIGEQGAIPAVAMDLHLREDSESLVIVCSRLRGGTIRFVPVKFGDERSLVEFIAMLQTTLQPQTFFFDGPLPLTRELDRELDRMRKRD